MKKIIVILILINIFFTIYSQEKKEDKRNNKLIAKNIVDISFEGGFGLYIGDFYQHLIRDGAFVVTPTLDLYISIYLIKYFGLQLMVGSGSVIHIDSKPIEGSIIYNGLEIFGQYDWKLVYIKIFAGAGFQHTTMLLQYYTSAFFEAGIGLGIKINDYLYWYNSFKYRMGFLNSILLSGMYRLEKDDVIMSLTFSTGIAVKIKNPYDKDVK
ncbi:MAG: hypothetical protein A2086_12825 [Spirochaetes bacterium GWD1_27_9]|nr:MAG: hypothetical protein A2Z98_00625 [Spirochaetes bacterium GWB1_27_13]OHD20544.1 MAG: hypothetical protein A2Y34_14330 [Spirochaetes bacterium GWC1_27_15]OHD43960.1 MAG: hypothetical protein A2086_12825 [Spirochaetes bacterium GWD1_27_9]